MESLNLMGRKPQNQISRPSWADALVHRRLIHLKRKSQEQVALDSGLLTQRTISDLETGRFSPDQLTAERLAALARGYEYRNVFEMQDDIGLDFKLGQPPPLLIPSTVRDYPEFVVLDVEPLSAAASPPADIPEVARSEKYIMPLSDYRQSIRIFIADGDSMAGGADGIQHGDALIVDTSDLTPRAEEVYVIRDDVGSIVVKRLQNWRGEWWLSSDNPKYPPFQLSEATLLGRVVGAEGKRKLHRN